MKKILQFLLLFMASTISLTAQLFCPDDITVSCLSDLTPDECGMATVVSGNYHPSMVKYVDQNETNACNEGIVYRKFYLDIDYNNSYSDNEPSCTQTITLVYSSLPLNIQFPTDKEYSCLDEIPVESPTWLLNPCDLVGYTYEDEIYEFEAGACLKIVRTYHVINWCVYDDDANEGLYSGIQIIKVIDEEAPEIDNCEDQYFDAKENCEAIVTLTNSAADLGDCPSGTLTWRVSVDLWGDGTEDLFYGPNEPLPFRLNPIENGATVEVDLPEPVGIAKHKVVWKVTDGCGNVRSCSSEFFVEDNKPPTPYCINFTGASLDGTDGGQLVIPASFFSLDAQDNCSSKENIILSFSENVEDTERIIECGDAGFQFFRIYYTDEAGNQDFCEVFMIVFDNGTCFMKYAPEGMITKPDGTPIIGANAYLMEENKIIALNDTDENGYFTFGDQDLMEVYSATVKNQNEGDADVDIEDFIMMRSALLGLVQLDFYQKIAADIDQSRTFDIDDLYTFRNVLLGKSEIEKEDLWTFIPKMYSKSSNQNNLEVPESIPYISYGEGFDFYGVQTGDLTGSGMLPDNEIIKEDDVELILEITKGGLVIISNQDFVTDAYQFDLASIQLENVVLSENNTATEIENGLRFINIKSSEFIHKDQVLLNVNAKISNEFSAEEIIKSAKMFHHGASKSSNINWTIIDKRAFSIGNFQPTEMFVYPLPMQDKLTIEAAGIEEISMYNMSGQEIGIEYYINPKGASIITQNSIPHGIYFMKIRTGNKEQIVKIVK